MTYSKNRDIENVIQVISSVYGGWNVRRFKGKKAIKNFANRGAAIAFGKKIAKQQGVDLYIHAYDAHVERVIHPNA